MHRCSDDTGCCMSDAYTCSPKSEEEVKAYFFVRSFESNSTDIEAITFTNHTECYCREKNAKPRLTKSQESWSAGFNLIDEPIDSDSPLIKPVSWPSTSSPVTEPFKRAKSKEFEPGEVRDAQCNATAPCPAPFKPILEAPSAHGPEGGPLKCTCDCESESDTVCLKMKQGIRPLPDRSGRCVSQRRCQPPRCQYPGEFDTVRYRCPRS